MFSCPLLGVAMNEAGCIHQWILIVDDNVSLPQSLATSALYSLHCRSIITKTDHANR